VKLRKYKKTAIFGTAHILRKVLMKQYKTYFTGKKKHKYSRQCNYRTAAKIYILEILVVLINIIGNTLHKGGGYDDDDNDNNNIERVSPRVFRLAVGE
jgi:hypothetical protein